MPYIDKKRRKQLEDIAVALLADEVTEGDLNYLITRLVDAFLHRGGRTARYGDYNTAIGVLECAKLELYRRLVAPYEDGKISTNGDVYEAPA